MNQPTRGLLVAVLLVISIVTQAQLTSPRPLLFSRFSDSLSCSATEIEKLFAFPVGSTIEARLAPALTLSGRIRAADQKYSNLKVVIIDCTSPGSAVFYVSARTDGEAVHYTGRMLGANAGDGFELQRDRNGNYQLKKFKVEDVIMD
jgi:hypothetical protein